MSRPRSPALLALAGGVLASACLPGLVAPPAAPVRSGLEIKERRGAPGIAAGPLRVVFASPEGEAEGDAAITLVFNKPMRALGAASSDADAPASILPALRGKWRWIGSLAARFEPAAPLPGATTFRVEIPAGARALDGSQLGAARILAFTTPRPALGASDPKDGARRIAATKPLTLWFNQPITDAELLRAVTITAGTSPVALPFSLARREGLAVTLAHELASRVQIDGPVARAISPDRDRDRDRHAHLLDSPVRASALVLRALVAVDPSHPLAARLAAGLLTDRRGSAWRTTHETAWALLALDAFRAAHATAPARFDARVFLGQGLLGEASFTSPTAPRSVNLTVPMARLRLHAAGGAPLTFAVVGAGQLSYEARLTYARAELPTEPLDAGFFVQRSLHVLAGAGAVPSSTAPPGLTGALTAGDLVQGEIEIVSAIPRDFVTIDDPLPGGLEAVDLDLDLGLGGAWLRRIDPGKYTRRELGDARVLYFIDHLPAGVTRLRYLARATGIGRFIRPPLQVEEMYAPEVFGRTTAEVITIRPAP